MRASPFPGFLENSCKKQKETLQQALGSREGGGLQCRVLASQPIILRVFQVDRVPGACPASPGLPLLSQTLPSSSPQAQRREKPSSRPYPQPSLQAFTEKELKGTIKLLNRNPHGTEGGTEAPRGNSTAPGHTVIFKPRTLSTTQNVSSCSTGLEVKYQVKALVLPASGKEDSVIHGPTLCFKGKGRAVC